MFVNRCYPPMRGASGRILQDMAQAFVSKGWRVSVLCAGQDVDAPASQNGVQIIRAGSRTKPAGVLGYVWIWLQILIKALMLPRSDIVVTLSDPPLVSVIGGVLKRFKGVRHIHWSQDVYPDLLSALGVRLPAPVMGVLTSLSRRSMKTADRVIVIGRCMAKHLNEAGIYSGAMSFIPNWPDKVLEPHFPKASAQGEEPSLPQFRPYENQLKADPKFRVLYAGNLGRAHALDDILEAAKILNTEQDDIEFTFVGEGARFEEIAAYRQQHGLQNINLLPYQPLEKLRDIMQSGDVHLISMKDEAAGLLVPCKFYSAMAVQRPCIFLGPKESEVGQIISEFKAGTIVPIGRAKDLAARIKHYRLNAQEWFAAHEGAQAAGKVFMAAQSTDAFISRAWSLIRDEVRAKTGQDQKKSAKSQL